MRVEEPHEPVTGFMRPAPHPNPDELSEPQDQIVADPISDETMRLWNETAKRNRDIFTEIFRPVPTNLVRDWDAYAVSTEVCSVSQHASNCAKALHCAQCFAGACYPRRTARPGQRSVESSERSPRRVSDGRYSTQLAISRFDEVCVIGLPDRPERLRRRN